MRPADLRPYLPLLGVAVLALLPLVLKSYWLFLVTSVIITAVMASSVGLLTGTAGMTSLCQLSFAGVAGWVVTYLNANSVPIPFVLQVLIGALVAVPVGVLIGLPALRLRGVNLAIVTLGFAAMMDVIFVNVGFPGAAVGRPVLRPEFLSSDRNYYWFCLSVFLLVTAGTAFVMQRRLGSSWLAVKYSERATAALGLSVPATKLSAFAASAFVAGLGGGLMAGQLGLLTARNFDPVGSLVLFATAVMAGARYSAGAMLTGVLTWFVPELLNRLRLPQDIGNLIFAIGTIQALSRGGGVFDLIAKARRPKGVVPVEHNAPSPAATVHSNPEIPASTGKAILELQDLGVVYGRVQALLNVNLKVSEGQVMGLIGPNGAGKSSLVDAVTGFTPYSGRVLLDGRPLEGIAPSQRAKLGLRRSFQQDRTIPELSVQAYLNIAAGRNLSAPERAEAMGFAGVTDPDLELYHLDSGARRMLEVAGILAARPLVVLFDEPAAGLSSAESLALGRRIAQIPSQYGCAVLLIEHDMDLVREACSEVTVLDFGQIIVVGPTLQVLSSPIVRAAYLGEDIERGVGVA